MATVKTTVMPVESSRIALNTQQQAGLDADVAKINRTYDDIAKEAYAAKLQNQKKAENVNAANGLAGSGYTETSKIALENNYLNGLRENEYARADALNEADKYYQELAKAEEETAYNRAMQERSMKLSEDQFTYQKEQDAIDRQLAAEQLAYEKEKYAEETAYNRAQDERSWQYQLDRDAYNDNWDETKWNYQVQQDAYANSITEREMSLKEAEFAYEKAMASYANSGSGSGSSGLPTGTNTSDYTDYYGNDANVQQALGLAQKFVANNMQGKSNTLANQAQFDNIVAAVAERYGTDAALAYRQYVESNMGWDSGSNNSGSVNAASVANLVSNFQSNYGDLSGNEYNRAYNSTYNSIKASLGEASAEAFAEALNAENTRELSYDEVVYAIKYAGSDSAAQEAYDTALASSALTAADKNKLMDTSVSELRGTTTKLKTATKELSAQEPFKSFETYGQWTSDETKVRAGVIIDKKYPEMAQELRSYYGLPVVKSAKNTTK